MVTTGRAGIVLAVLLCASAVGCSDHHPKLGADCSSVFASTATDAEGTCQDTGGPIHVFGTDCHNGSRLMMAEDKDGGDYAWARVGQGWHLLGREGTNAAAYRSCKR